MSSWGVLAALPEDHFQCSLCLNLFSDPVTTPCGHSFCKTCLSQRWDDSELCCCPSCNKRFQARPETHTNTVIAEISAQIKRRKVETLEADDEQVKCDVCTDIKIKASKSCLVCVTSYCEAHLEPHQRVPSLMRHKLVEPLENLEERFCWKHHRILELFCRVEGVCICELCNDTDHRDHETVTVEEEGAQQRETMESSKAKIQLMIEERIEKKAEFTSSVTKRREKTTTEMHNSDALFNSLTSYVLEMQAKLKSNMEQKLRKSEEKVEAVIQELDEEIAALQRTHAELEELSQSDDHLHLLLMLQALTHCSSTRDWSKVRVYSDLCIQTVRRAVGHLVNTFQAQLKTLTEEEMNRMRRYKESFTFDPDTAGNHLMIYDFGQRLKYNKNVSPTSLVSSGRFRLPMVLGTKGFTSGRHYWEVQVGIRNNWDVGVAKETVARQEQVLVHKEKGFYSIGKDGFDYEANQETSVVLHLCPRPRNVGVYVDYEEGRVSFYDVNEKKHVHSFTGEHFTGKLFPYFYLFSRTKKSEPLVLV